MHISVYSEIYVCVCVCVFRIALFVVDRNSLCLFAVCVRAPPTGSREGSFEWVLRQNLVRRSVSVAASTYPRICSPISHFWR